MDKPADPTGRDGGRYAVRLGGHLHPRWAARFDGMTLTDLCDGTTLLEGVVADQAALHGVLAKLRDLGVPLLALTRLDRDPVTPGAAIPSPAPNGAPDA